MNRRNVFKSLLGMLGICSVASMTSAPKKYGRLTVQGHRHHLASTGENLLVYVDGQEVLSCYEADDVEGYALAFCRDPQDHRHHVKAGHLHIGADGDACRVRLVGQVEFRPAPAGWKRL